MRYILMVVLASILSIPCYGQLSRSPVEAPQVKPKVTPRIISRQEMQQRSVPATSVKAQVASERMDMFKRSGMASKVSIPGYIMVSDEPALFDNTKEAMFVLTKNLAADSYFLLEMGYSDGSSYTVGSYFFPFEMSAGSGFPLIKGEIPFLAPQGPFTLRMYVIEPTEITYVESYSTTYGDEYSYSPKMMSVRTKNFGNSIKFTIDGNFHQSRDVQFFINWSELRVQNLTISSNSISFFADPSESWIPNGKFRITMCQKHICDNYVARRQN